MQKAKHLNQGENQRIAVFRALKLGDLLCAVPALRALRSAYPEAEITLVGLPWARSFVDRFDHLLDDFIEFPGHPAFPERQTDIDRMPGFFQELIDRRFDLAIQMHGSGSIINPIVALSGAKHTAGFYLPGEYCPDSSRYVIYPHHEPEIWRHLTLMAYLGIPLQGDNLEFPIREADRRELNALFHAYRFEPGNYVCIHPGASSSDKCWPPERFAAVADGLAQLGYQVILTGSQAEASRTSLVRNMMSAQPIDLAGETSLGALGALIAGARLLVSNDTGVAHIAAALQTPSVILFINSEYERWAPLNRDLHHTFQYGGRAAPEDVLIEAGALLEKGNIYVS